MDPARGCTFTAPWAERAGVGVAFDRREARIVDGVGTCIGGLIGGGLPTTVDIASVGTKEMRAGRGDPMRLKKGLQRKLAPDRRVS